MHAQLSAHIAFLKVSCSTRVPSAVIFPLFSLPRSHSLVFHERKRSQNISSLFTSSSIKLLNRARMSSARPKLTHFLCIPLVTPSSRPQLEESLSRFRTLVNEKIPEKAIRPLGTLHLTLGVMSLLETDQIDGALDLLRSLDCNSLLAQANANSRAASITLRSEAIEAEKPLTIDLGGLHSMHDPEKTSILYTSPCSALHTPTSLPLYQFALLLQQKFLSGGFLIADQRPLLLHATIVNTIYAPGIRKASGRGGGHGKSKAKLTLDAREILEECEEMMWMRNVRVEKISICRMGARKGEDGEEKYEVEGEVDMPA